MLDLLFNLGDNLLLLAGVLYLILCQLITKRKGFPLWYINGVIWGLSLPLMITGLGLGVYELMGGYY